MLSPSLRLWEKLKHTFTRQCQGPGYSRAEGHLCRKWVWADMAYTETYTQHQVAEGKWQEVQLLPGSRTLTGLLSSPVVIGPTQAVILGSFYINKQVLQIIRVPDTSSQSRGGWSAKSMALWTGSQIEKRQEKCWQPHFGRALKWPLYLVHYIHLSLQDLFICREFQWWRDEEGQLWWDPSKKAHLLPLAISGGGTGSWNHYLEKKKLTWCPISIKWIIVHCKQERTCVSTNAHLLLQFSSPTYNHSLVFSLLACQICPLS